MNSNARTLARSVLIVALISSVNLSTAHAQSFDGLKVFFCGTGGPLASSGRAQPCTAVQAGDALYLVDNGVGGWNTLRGMRAPVTSLKAILITHLHSDHIAGVGEAAEQSWINGRAEPLTVIGPDGVDNLANGFNLVYERDRVFRKAHHEHGDVKFPLDAVKIRSRIVKIPDPDGTALALKDGELTITAIRVAHDPVSPAFGYRFDYKGRSVVISGDTKAWPPLGVAAKGADVLIHEAQSNAMMMAASRRASLMNPRGAAILADTVTYHTEPREAAELAQSAGVRMLVLSHLTQAGMPGFQEVFSKGVEEGIEEGGKLDWRLAQDGMTLELPVGGTEIKVSE
jgi:ribonuclease Z